MIVKLNFNIKNNKMIENKIKKLGIYYDGMFPIKEKEGYNAVRVIFPKHWKIYNKEEGDISIVVMPIEEGEKYLFIGDEKTNLIDIFDFTIEVMENNLEGENKEKLFKQKIEELKLLFKENNLTVLKTLTFSLGEKKTKNKGIININSPLNPDDEIEGLEGLQEIKKIK